MPPSRANLRAQTATASAEGKQEALPQRSSCSPWMRRLAVRRAASQPGSLSRGHPGISPPDQRCSPALPFFTLHRPPPALATPSPFPQPGLRRPGPFICVLLAILLRADAQRRRVGQTSFLLRRDVDGPPFFESAGSCWRLRAVGLSSTGSCALSPRANRIVNHCSVQQIFRGLRRGVKRESQNELCFSFLFKECARQPESKMREFGSSIFMKLAGRINFENLSEILSSKQSQGLCSERQKPIALRLIFFGRRSYSSAQWRWIVSALSPASYTFPLSLPSCKSQMFYPFIPCRIFSPLNNRP